MESKENKVELNNNNCLTRNPESSETELRLVHRIGALEAANQNLKSVKPDDDLERATTIMGLENFSQLPVVRSIGKKGEIRTIEGLITWSSIGKGKMKGIVSNKISDYMDKNVMILDSDKPLLEAIPIIIENEYVLIRQDNNEITGIVTSSDINTKFIQLTKPFLLIEQIENYLRKILDGKILIDDLRNDSKLKFENLDYIDSLTFGN